MLAILPSRHITERCTSNLGLTAQTKQGFSHNARFEMSIGDFRLQQIRNLAAFLCLALCAMPLFAQALRITVSVPGPGAASYLPVELITRIGADRAEGAELTVSFADGGGIAVSEMLTNNADFAVVGLPAAMSARLKDKRVVALAAVNDLPLYVLMVRQGLQGKVKTIADLKGKTIGVHSHSITSKTTSQQVLELLLNQAGVPPNGYRLVSVGQRWESESSMLSSGEADAVMGDEPHATRMIEQKTAFSLFHLGDPKTIGRYAGSGFLRGALIGRSDRIEQDSKKAEVMVRILSRTLQWIATHSAEEFAEKLDIKNADERARLVALFKKYPRQYSTDGKFSARQLNESEIFFRKSQAANPAASSFALESMIIDRWSGRKD